ncbi:solute carrier organic anion transporter family member 1B2-like isoform X2 [Acanthaster planci]|uniref:Solute carrier organic anion transporter family member 1B2-like isoform X2 n=1 Tax=Acanthaster planci TaxID=133434 RepID=A0A8B7Y6I2_ACAPL|nr:solute carrier organic anion transporter family member 1B2-like isoform X2 [Acanthaster planci]
MASSPSPASPYLQIEFTAEDDMARASDADYDASDTAGNQRVGSVSLGTESRAHLARQRAVDSQLRAMTVSTSVFFIALILLIFITGFACRSFIYGILRILEEEIDLSGSETVTIVLSYDIGFLVMLVVMALQNRKVHRPRSIGFGAFLIGVGLLVVCIPYFIVRSDLVDGQWYISKYQLCDQTIRPPNLNETIDAGGQPYRPVHNKPPKTHWNSVAWIVMGMVLAGIGAVPQFPFGITYLEDKLRGFGTPFYVAILLCAYLLGIWCGELAKMFMWQHVATANGKTVTLWWLGFFCSALMVLVIGLLIFMAKDPYKKLVKETKGASSAIVMDRTQNGRGYRRLETNGEDRPRVPARWRRILTNVQLICLGVAGSCEVAFMTGFLLFLPRYVGTISRMGRGPAAFYLGTTIISSCCIGILTSSGLVLCRKIKFRGLCRMVITGSAVALFFTWPLYIFRCDSPMIVGHWTGTGGQPSNWNVGDLLSDLNTTSQCNIDCWCTQLPFRPVCGSDGRTYLSPCLAGCHEEQISDEVDSQGLKLTNFTDCSCIMTSNNTVGAYALSGPCPSDCSNEWPFLCLVFAVFFMVGVQFGPMILLSIRCVIRADRIAALSFHVSLWHILGGGNCIDFSQWLTPLTTLSSVPSRTSFVLPCMLGVKRKYLEARFNKAVACCGLFGFALFALLYMGLISFTACAATTAVTGLSFGIAVLCLVGICTIYTVIGGIKAVIWTDAIQMLLIFATIVVVIIKGSLEMGGIGNVWRIAQEGGRIQLLNISPDLTEYYTIWGFVIGQLGNLSTTVCNQYIIQRYVACKTLAVAKTALVFFMIGSGIFIALCVLGGVTLYAYYAGCDPNIRGILSQPDELLPYFVVEVFRGVPGMAGFLLSGVLGASLSTLSSAFNGMAILIGEHGVKQLCKNLTDEKYTLVLKVLGVTCHCWSRWWAFIWYLPSGSVIPTM